MRTRLISLLLASTAALYGGVFVYMTDSNSEFGTLDLTTAVFTKIADQSDVVFGMGFTPDGTLYAPTGNVVYRVNPSTGNLTKLGTVGPSATGSTTGSDGLIYAISFGPSSAFYTINPAGLATHTINGATGFDSDGLAAFHGGQFYSSAITGDTTPDVLERIDPVSGLVTQIGTSLGFQALAGGDVNGILYGVGEDGASGAPGLYTIDTSSGVGTLVGTITGMAANSTPWSFAAPLSGVPEPASGVLALVGLLAAACARSRSGWRRHR